MKDLIAFRRTLHQYPEVSGKEKDTARRVKTFIERFSPDEIIEGIGGYGIAFVYQGQNPGKSILFRCELDALPIEEVNTMEYVSKIKGVGHVCGHDGHMAIMAGFAKHLSQNRPVKGKVILLFQPEEETGQGAEKVIKGGKFEKLRADYTFALHNMPGYPHHTIVVSDRHFASASRGMVIKLKGKTSHAGEPEKGVNPAVAVSNIIRELNTLYLQGSEFKDYVLITFVHILMGEIAFGTSAGYAEMRATLRSYRDDDMRFLWSRAVQIVERIAGEESLGMGLDIVEKFPATINDPEASHMVEKAAEMNGFDIRRLTEPLRASEDFGHFTQEMTGALFGLGSGEDQPNIHNPDYDFPEEIIETGIQMFATITDNILKHKQE